MNIFTSMINKQEEEGLRKINELIHNTSPSCDLETGKKIHQEILDIITDIYENRFLYDVSTIMTEKGIVEISYEYVFYYKGELMAKSFITSAKGDFK